MKHIQVFALMILTLAISRAAALSATARADDIWTCAYAYQGGTLMEEYAVSDHRLIVRSGVKSIGPFDYQILQDNEYGIVAVSSISAIEQGQTQPTIGAVSIVINKRTFEALWTTAWFDPTARGPSEIVRGACIHGRQSQQ
jgi:hypothetical protein